MRTIFDIPKAVFSSSHCFKPHKHLHCWAVTKKFRKLSKIAVSHSGPVTSQAYEILADREAMPRIEAAILGGYKDHQSDVVLKALLRRLPPNIRVLSWTLPGNREFLESYLRLLRAGKSFGSSKADSDELQAIFTISLTS